VEAQLRAAIQQTLVRLAASSPVLTQPTRPEKLYEAWVFTCVVRALGRLGATMQVRDSGDNAAPNLLFRLAPGLIYSPTTASSFVFLTYNGRAYEIHHGVKIKDSAIIAALLVLELMSVKNQKLSDLVRQYDKYPSSGEINFMVKDKLGVMRRLETTYKNKARSTDWLDGISVWFTDWWFNVRPSNTEPLLRLNIEADNHKILAEHTTEIVSFLSSHGTIRQA